MKRKTCLDSKSNDLIDVQMIEEAKKFIIRMVPEFNRNHLQQKSNHEKQWKLDRLDPIFAEDRIIRVAGRLKRST